MQVGGNFSSNGNPNRCVTVRCFMRSFSNQAKWIGMGEGLFQSGIVSPAVQLRKVFEVNEIADAECLICGLGLYLLHINGVKVGDDVLSPAFTAYDKRALFMRYNVTRYLKKGQNILTVTLGDGYYNQTTEDEWHFYKAPWRNSPRLLLELFVGDDSVCVSDTTWRCTTEGAIVHNAIRTGEYYDARKEDCWRQLAYDDSAWQVANLVRPCGGELEEQKMPIIKEHETISAVAMWKSKNGWVYDFGKNIAGYVGIAMQGERGETVRIRYAEKLDGKEIDQSNIDFYVKTDAFSEDRYTFKGEGIEEWKPSFVYHGFQFVEIICKNEPTMSEVKAYHVYTDLARKGTFSSSDTLLNWIYDAGIRSFLNNFHGFPEDCPHREKNGWTGDAWLSSAYAIFNFDMLEAYKKWLKDICDTQRSNGQICAIAPTGGWGYNWGSGPSFDFSLFSIPYALYLETGDDSCIRLVYPYVKKYLNYLQTVLEEGTLCIGLGDWRPPDNVQDLKVIDNRFSDTCFYFAILRIFSKMAEIIQDKSAENWGLIQAEQTREVIKERYIQADQVDNCGQCALSFALYFHIVEGEQAKNIAKRLADVVRDDGYRFKTGIFGTAFVLNALSEYGYMDIAYKMVARYDYPSYGYWKKQGATTLWESWLGDASRNHHMYGNVIDWMTRNIVGLQNKGVAYNKCVFKPYFFGDVCSAETETYTPKGKLSFSWQKNGTHLKVVAKIPQGVEARLALPNANPILIASGVWEFEVDNG